MILFNISFINTALILNSVNKIDEYALLPKVKTTE